MQSIKQTKLVLKSNKLNLNKIKIKKRLKYDDCICHFLNKSRKVVSNKGGEWQVLY
jgi:UDP-N-acetylglucosamine pyrophosphorylase